MEAVEQWVMRWATAVVAVAGGLVLLARRRRHPRASRRGLAGVGVWLGLVLPLTVWWEPVNEAVGFRLYQWVLTVGYTAAYLLIAWAAVADRPPPAGDN